MMEEEIEHKISIKDLTNLIKINWCFKTNNRINNLHKLHKKDIKIISFFKIIVNRFKEMVILKIYLYYFVIFLKLIHYKSLNIY